MATQRPLLAHQKGLSFWKLVGMGSGIGFSARPDPLSWGLFAVWDSASAWERFRDQSSVMRQYRERGEEMYTLRLQPVSSHGRWSGVEPFGPANGARSVEPDEPLVVLTRATIRLRRALRFWSWVDPVDRELRAAPDLLLGFGIGEAPWIRQATLSVWRTTATMQTFAYASPAHREVIRRTRAEGWYAEELFARFRLLGTEGTLGGKDPLSEITPHAAP
jgi:heme-degrading monooxygenase HmoA